MSGALLGAVFPLISHAQWARRLVRAALRRGLAVQKIDESIVQIFLTGP
jgi:hypothetical protein